MTVFIIETDCIFKWNVPFPYSLNFFTIWRHLGRVEDFIKTECRALRPLPSNKLISNGMAIFSMRWVTILKCKFSAAICKTLFPWWSTDWIYIVRITYHLENLPCELPYFWGIISPSSNFRFSRPLKFLFDNCHGWQNVYNKSVTFV